MKTGCVYLARNAANGSLYIGKSLVGLHRRRSAHLNAARRGEDWAFYRAIRSHGQESFQEWRVLFHSDDDDALSGAEMSLIADYRGAGERLYNSTDGGKGNAGWKPSAITKARIAAKAKGRKQSEETKRKKSEAGRGRVMSEEGRRDLSESKKKYWAAQREAGTLRRGRQVSDEGRRRLSESATARWAAWRSGDKSRIGKPSPMNRASSKGSKAAD